MPNPEWVEPPDPVLGGEDQGGSDSAQTLGKRVDRYGKAKSRTAAMLPYIAQRRLLGDPLALQVHERIQDCANWMEFAHYHDHDKVRLHRASFCCQHLLCAVCAIRRGGRMLERYVKRWEAIQLQNPGCVAYLMTVTVKNGDDLEERMQHCRTSLVRLFKRRFESRTQSVLRGMLGAVWSYELTNNGKGWHPHAHCVLVMPSAMDAASFEESLKAEWYAITGDSYIVDVRPFQVEQEAAEAFCEVFKYALKMSDLSFADQWEAATLLRGRNLVGSAGCFRGVKIPESLLDDPLSGPFTLFFYRYVRGHYHLRRIDDRSVALQSVV